MSPASCTRTVPAGAEVAPVMNIDREALVQAFLEDAAENLASMEQSLATLAERPDDHEAAQTAFRGAHTIKGNAATLGLPDLTEVARLTQEVLDRLRNRLVRATPELLLVLRRSADTMRAMVPAAGSGERQVPAPPDLIRQLVSWKTCEVASPPDEGE